MPALPAVSASDVTPFSLLPPQSLEEVALLLFVKSFAPGRFFITQGIVGRWGRVVTAGLYVGEDMIVTEYVRNYTVSTLSYVDAYRLERDALFELLENDKFPRVGVRAGLSFVAVD